MDEGKLTSAVAKLARATHFFSDNDLEQPWVWGPHDEGVRFALLGTYHELQDLAARLLARRQAEGPPLSEAQVILGQHHRAYRELQALLLGAEGEVYDRPPSATAWPLRRVLAHIVDAERMFFALIRYAAGQHRAGTAEVGPLPKEEYKATAGSDGGFEKLAEEGTLAEMLAYYGELHLRILRELSELSAAELDLVSPWWEEEPVTVRHRLHRFTAHLLQHSIQVEKTLVLIGHAPGEARLLLRHVYGALAEVEGALLGARDMALEEREALATGISRRADEVAAVVQMAHSLLEAVRENDLERIYDLAELNPAIVDAVSETGLSAVMTAAYAHRFEVVDALADLGAYLTIFEGAATGRMEPVRKAVERWPGWLKRYAADGFTALQLACYFGHEEIAIWLVEQGADVDAVAKNPMGIRPIHACAVSGSLRAMEVLLDAGADPDAAQEGGYTALHQAAHRGNADMARLLLKHGADPLLPTGAGQTPVEIAHADGHPEVAAIIESAAAGTQA